MNAEFVWECRLYIFQEATRFLQGLSPKTLLHSVSNFGFLNRACLVIVPLKMTSKTQISVQEAAGFPEETPGGPALRTEVFKPAWEAHPEVT